jgi:hypothetical protein
MEVVALIIVACLFAGREAGHHLELKRRDAREVELLNRIKPETAQPLPDQPMPEPITSVSMFDDREYWKNVDGDN